MATFSPRHVIVADDAADLAAVKAYLDSIGYTVGGALATRTDDDGSLTVTVEYPDWVL